MDMTRSGSTGTDFVEALRPVPDLDFGSLARHLTGLA
jgi:hypothetical protein